MAEQGMTYAGTGVDMPAIDRFGVNAQRLARETDRFLQAMGRPPIQGTRGRSAFIIRIMPNLLLGVTIEGLGTKNLVAEAIWKLLGRSYFRVVGQDTLAMIANDCATSGARITLVGNDVSTGGKAWFANETGCTDFLKGWYDGCCSMECGWGGGETAILRDLIFPDTASLCGFAIGLMTDDQLIPEMPEDGDAIIVMRSTGIHANGLTLARELVDQQILPGGYLEHLPCGRTYGEALLEPTPLYAPIVQGCQRLGVRIHAFIPVTGHGFSKFMRPDGDFTYVIETLPKPLPILEFIQERGHVADQEMYDTYNMGVGAALYVPQADAEPALRAIGDAEVPGARIAFIAGTVHASPGERRVIVTQKPDLKFEELNIR